ncbi:uncharacterized protein SPSK_08622 [Sporothrix schenckii 1099-18]|uniref:Endonuclease/exonuclease/phosphatase family protein n=1 Tax=Sporothrix schenckii 1099-18 TaxID=1397361 RepID=A0A0F2M5I5_SPOSC|nr:uncharacterized protein SPSK_08622 [Sporothrix schenckii 1099-18]KJR84374.1 hypothetical protein SPSK_08622 [Sporothrix schenckii 1099-18]
MNNFLATLALTAVVAQAQSIHDITGNRFLSPYNGQSVSGVVGVVTAKSSAGLFLRSPKLSCDARIGNGLYVYSSTLGGNASIAIGDTLTLSGKVSEYRSSAAYLYSTELESPVVQGWAAGKGGAPKPRVLGSSSSLSPPTEQFTSLDGGDIFGVPNNVSQVSVANPKLQPEVYGLDFWKALNGDLVTLPRPVAIAKPNSYGETWMVGNWTATGRNGRGGLTLGSKDANPEAIIVGAPLDGTKAVTTYKIGDTFGDITGVVHYQYGFYYLLPLVAPVYKSSAAPALPPPTTLRSTGTCAGLTVGDYNIENFAPSDTAHVAAVAAHIVDYMKTPDVLFVQEIQDNNGATDNGVVDSSLTLSTLVAAIASKGGLQYSYTWINPVNDADGGQPGGNIRQAYLYNAAVVRLAQSTTGTAGGALDANAVVADPSNGGKPALKYNPGRIDPTNAAWASSRKPLAAAWQTVVGSHVFFTVNVHWESKGGSSSLQGDLRPPVNLSVAKRTQQAQITGAFIKSILSLDGDARVIMGGDLNEYSVVQPVTAFANVSGMVDLDVAAGIPAEERYTYTFDNNMEELDHVFVSSAIAALGPKEEHLHVNTWVSYNDQTSDHDPTVALLNVCGANVAPGGGISPSSVVSSLPSSTPAASSTLSTVTRSSTSSVSASSAPASSASASSSSAPAPSGSAVALSGKGHLEVSSPGVASGGVLITAGTWYRGGGTPATYTATPAADGVAFTLNTSKGKCAVQDDASLLCASTVTTASSFGYDGSYLTHGASNTFYAKAVPSGTTQGTIYTKDQSGVILQISWVQL